MKICPKMALETLRRMAEERAKLCLAQSDDDPPVTCSMPKGHDGTRCGTIEWV